MGGRRRGLVLSCSELGGLLLATFLLLAIDGYRLGGGRSSSIAVGEGVLTGGRECGPIGSFCALSHA